MTTLLALTLLKTSAPKWTTYANPRFSFSVDRPSDLTPGSEPENGDGLSFSGHGLKVTAYGGNRINGPSDEFKVRLAEWKKSGKINYRLMKPSFFVISGKEGDRDFYQRTIIGKESYATVLIEYPSSDRANMKSPIEHMGKSLRFD